MDTTPQGCDRRNCLGKRWDRFAFIVFVAVASLATPSSAWQDYNRWVDLEGVDNFRDIGGFDAGTTAMVATGLVYRSANLNNSVMTATTFTVADADIIRSLNIGLIIDLRTPGEVASWPDSALLDDFTTHAYFPLGFAPGGWHEAYRHLATDNGDTWRQIFEILADPANLPLEYHCQAGKDRTGVLTALILTFLGVERNFVENDYLLSNIAYNQMVVDPSWLQATLEEIDAVGGMDNFLEAAGVTAPVREAVRRNLLVQRPTAVRRHWRLYR